MPLYDYRCRECGQVWELSRSIPERHGPTVCPACGGAGWLVMRVAPHLAWYPGTTRPNFKEKLREGI